MKNVYLKLELPAETGDDAKLFVEVEVYYDKGGYSCLTGRKQARGVFVFVDPVTHRGTARTYRLGAGCRALLEETARKNDKVGVAAAAAVRRQVEEKRGRVWDMVQKVCTAGGIRLKASAEEETHKPAFVAEG